MQVDQPPVSSTPKNKREAQKQRVAELKVEWKQMWLERFNDKVKAEGVTIKEYNSLQVNRGTVIHATRDFKALSFHDIVKKNLEEDSDLSFEPNTEDGGWNKFIRTKISRLQPKGQMQAAFTPAKNKGQQTKKGGRGWLHST